MPRTRSTDMSHPAARRPSAGGAIRVFPGTESGRLGHPGAIGGMLAPGARRANRAPHSPTLAMGQGIAGAFRHTLGASPRIR